MKTWYSCKVKHAITTEDGRMKQVTDTFLVDGVSFTDAEKRIYEISERDIRGEFMITNIAKTNIAEVINYEDSETWFKCKVAYVTIDEEAQKEKKINSYFLVGADNAKLAYERIEDNLSSMMVPVEIPAISMTTIVDVFPFNEEEYNQQPPEGYVPVEHEEEAPAHFPQAGTSNEEEATVEEADDVYSDEQDENQDINTEADSEYQEADEELVNQEDSESEESNNNEEENEFAIEEDEVQ